MPSLMRRTTSFGEKLSDREPWGHRLAAELPFLSLPLFSCSLWDGSLSRDCACCRAGFALHVEGRLSLVPRIDDADVESTAGMERLRHICAAHRTPAAEPTPS